MKKLIAPHQIHEFLFSNENLFPPGSLDDLKKSVASGDRTALREAARKFASEFRSVISDAGIIVPGLDTKIIDNSTTSTESLGSYLNNLEFVPRKLLLSRDENQVSVTVVR